MQSDYKLLQDSYDNLEASRDAMKKELTAEREELEMKCAHLEEDKATVADVFKELESTAFVLREKIGSLQSALDQSEFQLAECEKRLQVRLCNLNGKCNCLCQNQ